MIAFFGFITAGLAQVERGNADDKIQQEPPRPAQAATERAARQADVNAQNNKSVRASEDRIENEVERSTGKPMENPAVDNPKTVRPPALSDPVSAPVGTPTPK